MTKKCKTPGTFFWSQLNKDDPRKIKFAIHLPYGMKISQRRARKLEKVFHDAMEEALADMFKNN